MKMMDSQNPSEWANQRKMAMEKARQIKEERRGGITTEEHTFAPKVNKRPSFLNAKISNENISNNIVSNEGTKFNPNDPMEQKLPGNKGKYLFEPEISPRVAPASQPLASMNPMSKEQTSDKNKNGDIMCQFEQQSGVNANRLNEANNPKKRPPRQRSIEISMNPESDFDKADETQNSLFNSQNFNFSNDRQENINNLTRLSQQNELNFSMKSPVKSPLKSPLLQRSPRIENVNVAKSRLSLLKSKMRRSESGCGSRPTGNNDDNRDCSTAPTAPLVNHSTNDLHEYVPRRVTKSSSQQSLESADPNQFKASNFYSLDAKSMTIDFDSAPEQQSKSKPSRRAVSQKPAPSLENADPNQFKASSFYGPTTNNNVHEDFPAHEQSKSRPSRHISKPASNVDDIVVGSSNRSVPAEVDYRNTNSENHSDNMDSNDYDDSDGMHTCPDCKRRFNELAFSKHTKICKKVFMDKRKAFDSKKMRINDNPELVKLLAKSEAEEKKNNKKEKIIQANAVEVVENNIPKWKKDSETFRNAMKSSKAVTEAIKEGKPLPPPIASAPDPSLIPCPNCNRRFSEKAAERHIPKCAEIKAKPSMLKRGTGLAGGIAGGPKEVMNKTGGSKNKAKKF